MIYSRMGLEELLRLKDSLVSSLRELPDRIRKYTSGRDAAGDLAKQAAVSEAAASVIDSKGLEAFSFGKDKKEHEAAKRRYEDLLHKAVSKQANYRIALRGVEEAITDKQRMLKQECRKNIENRVTTELVDAQAKAGEALAKLFALVAHKDCLRPEAIDRSFVIQRYLEVDRKLSHDTSARYEALEADAVASAKAKL